jgi:hypothetical protein
MGGDYDLLTACAPPLLRYRVIMVIGFVTNTFQAPLVVLSLSFKFREGNSIAVLDRVFGLVTSHANCGASA